MWDHGHKVGSSRLISCRQYLINGRDGDKTRDVLHNFIPDDHVRSFSKLFHSYLSDITARFENDNN